MISIRKVGLACMMAAMVTFSVTAGAQGPANQDTFFTFSQAVELPNKTLPAGTYFFQLMDSQSNRHIVKVMSQDRKELFATLMAIPFQSNDRPTDDPQVRFMETPATATNGNVAPTNAIKLWFYPGNSIGHEFIYPRAQALRIASSTGQSVLTTKTDEVAANSELTRVDATGTDAAVATEAESTQASAQPAPVREQVGAITGSQPQPERVEQPTPAPAPTAAPMPERTAERTAERTDLPRTAGVLPLLALLGLGSLAGSRVMRRARQ